MDACRFLLGHPSKHNYTNRDLGPMKYLRLVPDVSGTTGPASLLAFIFDKARFCIPGGRQVVYEPQVSSMFRSPAPAPRSQNDWWCQKCAASCFGSDIA